MGTGTAISFHRQSQSHLAQGLPHHRQLASEQLNRSPHSRGPHPGADFHTFPFFSLSGEMSSSRRHDEIIISPLLVLGRNAVVVLPPVLGKQSLSTESLASSECLSLFFFFFWFHTFIYSVFNSINHSLCECIIHLESATINFHSLCGDLGEI